MGSTVVLNQSVEVDVLAPLRGKAPIKRLDRLTFGGALSVGIERPLHDFGSGDALAPRDLISKLPRPDGQDQELRFRHRQTPAFGAQLIDRWRSANKRARNRTGSAALP